MKAFEILSEAPNLPPGTTTSAGGIVVPQSTQDQIDREAKAKAAQDAKDQSAERKRQLANKRQKTYDKMHPVKSKLGNIFGYDPNKDPKKYAKDFAKYRAKLKEIGGETKQFPTSIVRLLGIFNLGIVAIPELVSWWEDRETNENLYKLGLVSYATYEFSQDYNNWRLKKVVAPLTALAIAKLVSKVLLTLPRLVSAPIIGAELAGGPPGWVIALFHTASLVGAEFLVQSDWFQHALTDNIEAYIVLKLLGVDSEKFNALQHDFENQLKAVSKQQENDLTQLKALQQKVNPD
jgi:membrane-associated HD superfamily phosphohydrolase